MSHEPGLRFWLRYAEREGGLVEDDGDQAVAVLPERLRRGSGLPEEVVVTSDPDTAREDGAVLLISGHPALEHAASEVLAAGDVGRRRLAWPSASAPRRDELQDRARAHFQIDHGRVDAVGDVRAAYLPLLRVGAMVSYAASLRHRVQEQEEVWVDGRTCLPVAEHVVRALQGRPHAAEPDRTHSVLDVDLSAALHCAHGLLEGRAGARRTVLLAQAEPALAGELAQTDAYFRDALASIERRRANAPPDRRRLLEDQAAATRAQHDRRRGEIRSEFAAEHEIRPFRLHLVLAPAYVVRIDVRRGARRFPFALTWIADARTFADPRCPHCSAAAPLVAGRNRLGCRSCLPRTVAADRPPPSLAPADAQGRRAQAATARPAVAPQQSGTSAPPTGETGPARPSRLSAPPPPPRSTRAQRRRAGSPASRGPQSAGNKLAIEFWQAVADGEPWPRRKIAPNSPLRALYRLYGPAGPLHAIGAAADRCPSGVTALTIPSIEGPIELTAGSVQTGTDARPYALTWWLHDGRPVVAEVTPSAQPAACGPSRPRTRGAAAAHLYEDAPQPRVSLDPVAHALWQTELPQTGLPVVVRCLATWWRIQDEVESSAPAPALAAAIAAAIRGAAGMRRRDVDDAAYCADPDAIRQAARDLRPLVRPDRARGW